MRIDDDVAGPAAAWPLAVLLTDDRAGAEKLVTAALSGRHREPAELRRAVARAALDLLDAAPPPAPNGVPDPGTAALADALRTLPRRTRTLAVSALLDPATAAGLGTPREADDTVAALSTELGRQDARHRAEREQFEAPFRAPGSTPRPAEPDHTPLPDRLRTLAARTPLSDARTADLVQDAADRRRTRRRTQRRVLAAVLVLAGLVALVRVVPWPTDPAPPVDVFAGPTRGSLAADADFLAKLREQSWTGTDLATEPPPPSRRVVWADDVDGGRAALVVSGEGRDFAAAWFAGPPGAPPREMRVQAVQLTPDRTLPVALAAPVRGALVVVGAPGDEVAYSPRPEISDEGTVTREWSPADTVDGVTTVTLPQSTRTDSPAVRFRVTRAGGDVPAGPVDVVTEPDPGPPWLPRLRSAPGPAVGDTAVAQQLEDLLGRLGQRADTSGTTVLWAGDLPGRDARTVRTAVIAIPQPSGSVVVTSPFGYARDLSGRADSSTCVTGVLPSGPPLADRAVALRCALGAPEPLLLVVAPRGAERVRLLDAGGNVLDDRAMDDGVAMVTSPGLVTAVEVDTAAGDTVSTSVLAETDLRG